MLSGAPPRSACNIPQVLPLKLAHLLASVQHTSSDARLATRAVQHLAQDLAALVDEECGAELMAGLLWDCSIRPPSPRTFCTPLSVLPLHSDHFLIFAGTSMLRYSALHCRQCHMVNYVACSVHFSAAAFTASTLNTSLTASAGSCCSIAFKTGVAAGETCASPRAATFAVLTLRNAGASCVVRKMARKSHVEGNSEFSPRMQSAASCTDCSS